MKKEDYVIVKSIKYDNSWNYNWDGILEYIDDKNIVLKSNPGRKIIHHKSNKVYEFNNWSVDYFSFSDWFSISASTIDMKNFTYYCNICMPIKIENNSIILIDLDLDYFYKNNEWNVLDRDEFEENRKRYKYPNEIVEKAESELEKLINYSKKFTGPFDGRIKKYFTFLNI